MAPGRGFEPRLTDPESAVLPLDDPGKWRYAGTPLASDEYDTTGKAILQPLEPGVLTWKRAFPKRTKAGTHASRRGWQMQPVK